MNKAPDETACFAALVQLVHGRWSGWVTFGDPPRPAAPKCPHCRHEKVKIHRSGREPVLDYVCHRCRRVFNAWQGTAFQGTHRRPSELVALVAGIARKERTCELARILGCNRAWLVRIRRGLEAQDWMTQLKTHVQYHAQDINGIWLSTLEKLLRHGRGRPAAQANEPSS